MKIEKVSNLTELNDKIDSTMRCVLHFRLNGKPCQRLHQPLHDELSKIESDNCIYINCDSNEHEEIFEEYGIKKFPTFLFIENKETLDTLFSSKLTDFTSKLK